MTFQLVVTKYVAIKGPSRIFYTFTRNVQFIKSLLRLIPPG